MKDLHQCLERCGYRGLNVMALNGWTASEGAIEDTMAKSKIRFETGSNGEVKAGND